MDNYQYKVDPTEEAKRQLYLEELYAIDGRHDSNHPMHALYTGLVENRRQHLIERDIALLTDSKSRGAA